MDKNQIITPIEQHVLVSNNIPTNNQIPTSNQIPTGNQIPIYHKIFIRKVPILYDIPTIKPIFICNGSCGKCIDKPCLFL